MLGVFVTAAFAQVRYPLRWRGSADGVGVVLRIIVATPPFVVIPALVVVITISRTVWIQVWTLTQFDFFDFS